VRLLPAGTLSSRVTEATVGQKTTTPTAQRTPNRSQSEVHALAVLSRTVEEPLVARRTLSQTLTCRIMTTIDVLHDSDVSLIGRWGPLFVVKWKTQPTVAEFAVIQQLVAEAVSRGARVYCGISDHDQMQGVPTDSGVKEALQEGSKAILRNVSEFHVVMKGQSMAAILARSTYKAIGFVIGKAAGGGKVVAMHATLDAFVESYSTRTRTDQSDLRAAMEPFV
jgi:hypothetical protein